MLNSHNCRSKDGEGGRREGGKGGGGREEKGEGGGGGMKEIFQFSNFD